MDKFNFTCLYGCKELGLLMYQSVCGWMCSESLECFILCFLFCFCIQDFEIDESSREYLALHPMPAKKQPSLVEEHFEPVMEDEDQSLSDSDATAASQSSEGELDNEERKTKKKARVPR
jgi:hypothetical protein